MSDDKSTESQNHNEAEKETNELGMREFLESVPPNNEYTVSDLAIENVRISSGNIGDALNTPEIQLHCTFPDCNGLRFFRCITNRITCVASIDKKLVYITYRCSNCRVSEKTFSLSIFRDDWEAVSGKVLKIGEIPPFGPPVPSRLIKLIGPDRELFLRGRRCESQGLGIGAFVYYRRVVEDQKNRILEEIKRVAEKLDAGSEVITEIDAALSETQFSAAVKSIKTGLPQILMINGHNPLLLLHNALSEGVHDRSDEECLQLAKHVKVVLVELSDRLSQALKDKEELNSAVTELAKIKSNTK